MRPRSRATDPLPCRFPQHLSGPAGSVGAQDREVPHRVGGQVMKTWATHDTQGRRHGREDAVAPEILRLGGRLVQGAARRCRLPPRPTWSPTDQIPAAPGPTPGVVTLPERLALQSLGLTPVVGGMGGGKALSQHHPCFQERQVGESIETTADSLA